MVPPRKQTEPPAESVSLRARGITPRQAVPRRAAGFHSVTVPKDQDSLPHRAENGDPRLNTLLNAAGVQL